MSDGVPLSIPHTHPESDDEEAGLISGGSRSSREPGPPAPQTASRLLFVLLGLVAVALAGVVVVRSTHVIVPTGENYDAAYTAAVSPLAQTSAPSAVPRTSTQASSEGGPSKETPSTQPPSASASNKPRPSASVKPSVSRKAIASSQAHPATAKGLSYDEFVALPQQKMSDDSHLRRVMPNGIPPVSSKEYFQKCASFHGGSATQVQPADPSADNVWNVTRSSKHAIAILAAGDKAARGAVALVQSLREVRTCPGIDVWVLIAGGVPSTDCLRHPETILLKGHTPHECESDYPAKKVYAVSQVYLDAIHSLGARTTIIPYLSSTTASIPGGRHAAWGLSFNKLRVFGMQQYSSVLTMDSDTIVLQNLDHLLFYPDFTAAFTQDCCNGAAQPRPSGGFWLVEPSTARMQQIQTMVNGPDPLVPLGLDMDEAWHFADMAVVTVLFIQVRKVPPYYNLPEAMDARISEKDIKAWYSTRGIQERVRRWQQATKKGPLLLGSEADLTTFPSKPEHLGDYEFVVSNKNGNLGDRTAFDIGHPEIAGRRWHMLNESYDFLAIECQCLKKRDLGPLLFSVHFSCLPGGVEKPGFYPDKAGQQLAVSQPVANMQPCLAEHYKNWMRLYEAGMQARKAIEKGKLLPDVWEQQGGHRHLLRASREVPAAPWTGWLSTQQRPPWTSPEAWAAAAANATCDA